MQWLQIRCRKATLARAAIAWPIAGFAAPTKPACWKLAAGGADVAEA
jgi:hypothetical protein